MKKLVTLLLLFGNMYIANGQKLGLNLQQGKTYFHNSSTDIKIKQDIQGNKVDYGMRISSKIGFLIKEVGEDFYLMDARYEDLVLATNSPFGNSEFNSNNENPEDLMSNMLSRLVAQSFEVKMKKDGTIEAISNLEKIFTGLLDEYPDLPEMQKTQIREQMKQSYGENSLKGNLQMITDIFPEKEVKVNDSWNKQVTLQSSMKLFMDSRYTLKEISSLSAVIAVSGSAKTSDDSKFEEMNGMPTKFDLTGNMNGTLTINRQSGWIEQGDIHQEYKGNVQLGDSPQFPGGITIPMEMVNNTKISNN